MLETLVAIDGAREAAGHLFMRVGQDIDAENAGFADMAMGRGVLVDADQQRRGIGRHRADCRGDEAVAHALIDGGDQRNACREAPHAQFEVFVVHEACFLPRRQNRCGDHGQTIGPAY